MKKIFSSLIRHQSGQGALVIVLILLVLGAVMLTPLLAFMGTGLKAGQMHESRLQELYAAESGVEDAIHWLIHGKGTEGPWSWDETAGSGEREHYSINNDTDVYVTVEEINVEGYEGNTYKIVSEGTSGGTTVLATVWAIHIIEGTWDPDHDTYTGDVYVDGDVDTGTHAEIIGDVYATGDIDLHNHSSITGTVSVQGDITLEPQTAVTGNVCASGDITVRNDAIITGDIYVTGDNTITLEGGTQKEARIKGDIYADGNITIVARNSATIEGNIYVTGNLSIMLEQPHSEIVGDVYATGDISIPPDQLERITGNVTANYEVEYPPPPDCPLWDIGDPTDIMTLEIT